MSIGLYISNILGLIPFWLHAGLYRYPTQTMQTPGTAGSVKKKYLHLFYLSVLRTPPAADDYRYVVLCQGGGTVVGNPRVHFSSLSIDQ